MILTRSSSRNCKMTFIIGRGFAERQILKKWKWPYLLNWVEYFDKLLRNHWYWQEIANWHCSSVEALPSSKFWKSENGPTSWTEWNILINFCVTIDIYKRLRTDIFHRSRLCRAPNSNKVIMALSLELSGIFYEILHTHWYWQDVPHEIVKWHLRLIEFLPRFKLFIIGWGFADAKFWKREHGLISKAEWNILIDYCVNIDIDKI